MFKKVAVISFLLLMSVMGQMKSESKIIWIDVRTTEEFDAGHIKGALHIPYDTIGKEISKVTQDKQADIRVYCKVGGRAGIAKKTLNKLGYKNVTNSGGYKQILKKMKKGP